jgi:hypothetical protein
MANSAALEANSLHIYRVLFRVSFVVASISVMTVVVDIVAMDFCVTPTFIAAMAIVMHADGNAVWAKDHGVRHGTRCEVRSAQG